MVLRSSSRRQVSPWVRLALEAVHHDNVEVRLLEAGALHHRLAGVPGVLGAGDMIVVAAGAVHSSWTEQLGACETILQLDAACLGSVRSGVWAAREAWPGLWTAVLQAGPEELGAAALAILHATQGTEARPSSRDPRIARVTAAVKNAPQEEWTLDLLARVASMSPAHFSRTFTAALGRPPMCWVIDQRVARAEWLIAGTDRTLGDIADAVGFASSSRLTEAFQHRHQQSPSAWRTANKPSRSVLAPGAATHTARADRQTG